MKKIFIVTAILLGVLLFTTLATPSSARASPPPAPNATMIVYHIVRPGEWVYGIARTYGVSPWNIISANNLYYPYRIYPGQRLAIPISGGVPYRLYVVQPGNTLFSIARLYGVSWTYMAALNHIYWPYTIYVGETLVIPW